MRILKYNSWYLYWHNRGATVLCTPPACPLTLPNWATAHLQAIAQHSLSQKWPDSSLSLGAGNHLAKPISNISENFPYSLTPFWSYIPIIVYIVIDSSPSIIVSFMSILPIGRTAYFITLVSPDSAYSN